MSSLLCKPLEPSLGAPRSAAKAMRCLQIGAGWFPEQPGGLDRYFYDLLHHLPGAGVESRGLVVASGDTTLTQRLNVHSFSSANVRIDRRIRAARAAVAREVESFAPDLIVSHFALYGWGARQFAHSHPHVVHFHGPWAAESAAEGEGRVGTILKKQLERTVYKSADLLITLSAAFANVLTQSYRIPEERIRIVRGGIDVSRFDIDASRQAARVALDWPLDRPIVLTVRRLAARMGLSTLIEAASDIRRRHPDALILIAGGGRLSEELNATIRAKGLADHVRLLGFVPDDSLPLAYRAADFCVVPSQQLEGFGLVAAESLAAGTPVLVTPVGGLPEVVRDLSPGLVLAGSDSGSLAQGIDAALRGSIRLPDQQACARFARSRYDWPEVAKSVVEVYQEAIAAREGFISSSKELGAS